MLILELRDEDRHFRAAQDFYLVARGLGSGLGAHFEAFAMPRVFFVLTRRSYPKSA